MPLEFLNFMAALVIIIVSAKAAGYLTTRIGQPTVLGELLAGVLLGPTLFDVFHTVPMLGNDAYLLESIKLMAKLGVVVLMLLAGLQLDPQELLRSGKVSALAGTLGVIMPLVLGGLTSLLFGATAVEALFVGLGLSATSVSISAQTLMELNVLRSEVGVALVGAAVFDDILVILLLSFASLLVGGAAGGLAAIGITVLRMVGYLVAAVLLGLFVLPPLARVVHRLPISQGLIAFVLCAALVFAWAAEAVGGIAAITGAFLVGLFLGRLPFKDQIESGIATLAYGFLVPIFFVEIGLEVNMRAISANLWGFTLLLIAVTVLSKVIGCGSGALLSGFSRRDALRLGIGMVSRGEVGLIVAAFALSRGLLTGELFSIVVFMVIIATLVTPPLLRAVYRTEPSVTGRAS